jgi:hypothetical protein
LFVVEGTEAPKLGTTAMQLDVLGYNFEDRIEVSDDFDA